MLLEILLIKRLCVKNLKGSFYLETSSQGETPKSAIFAT